MFPSIVWLGPVVVFKFCRNWCYSFVKSKTFVILVFSIGFPESPCRKPTRKLKV